MPSVQPTGDGGATVSTTSQGTTQRVFAMPARVMLTVAFVAFVIASFSSYFFFWGLPSPSNYDDYINLQSAVFILVSIGLVAAAVSRLSRLSQRAAIGALVGGVLAYLPLAFSWRFLDPYDSPAPLKIVWGFLDALPLVAIAVGFMTLTRRSALFTEGDGTVRLASSGLAVGIWLDHLVYPLVGELFYGILGFDFGSYLNALAIVLLITAVICLTIGFLLFPWFIAYQRNSPQATAILVFSLFLGWLTIPWIIALVWAFSSSPTNRSPQVTAPSQVIKPPPVPVTPPTNTPGPDGHDTPGQESDSVTSLKQLADLRDQGIITDEEFEAKKAEILKRM